jgi:hypothetical protein
MEVNMRDLYYEQDKLNSVHFYTSCVLDELEELFVARKNMLDAILRGDVVSGSVCTAKIKEIENTLAKLCSKGYNAVDDALTAMEWEDTPTHLCELLDELDYLYENAIHYYGETNIFLDFRQDLEEALNVYTAQESMI